VTVRFGACVLDPEARELRRGGEPVHLSPKALELLLVLLQNRPRSLSKADLRERLWPATFVHEANLPNLVAEVRAAIGDDARRPRFLRTVHTFGYAFSGPAVEGEPTPGKDEPRAFVYRLVAEAGSATLVEGDHLLGRHPDSVLELRSGSVSRRHARLRVSRGHAVLEDLGSRNGTFLREERLRGPARLEDGDEFRLGSVRLTFRVLRAPDFSETA
jgi:DNA-binding winged helix-turn-helix (wHTH) protein